MKKLFWFLLVPFFSVSVAFSQNNDDNTYYTNNDNSNNGYNYGYDNSYNHNYNGYDDQSNNSDQGYQAFYDQLSPYGSWVNYDGYGYVWVPNQVEADFSPYRTAGHWVYSDYGWTWVSDYSWGWAPFHYGRWFHDDSYGWMWMPGSEWAPAWVTWGSYSGNYCWAPIAPFAELSVYYRPEPYYWNFVPCGQITQFRLGAYVNNNAYIQNNITVINNNITIINQAGSYNNHTYFAGPRRQEVEQLTHQTIAPVSVTSVNHAVGTQVHGNEMTVYRPEIKRTSQPAAQFRQQGNVNPVKVNGNTQGFNNAQRSNSINAAQNQRMQQYPVVRQNNPVQNQRSFNQGQPVQRQQQYSQPQRQNYQMPAQRSFAQGQPVQRQPQYAQPARQTTPERSFNQSQPVQRQQQYSQPQRQSYQAPVQRSLNQSQPVQRPVERSFASAQHVSQPNVQSARPSAGGQSFNRGGRR